MKILMACPLFPPDTGVSTLRMKSFYDQFCAQGHDVEVLKLGEKTDFSGNTKLIDRSLFRSFFSSLLLRWKIRAVVSPLLTRYDLVLVSATPYQLYSIAHCAKLAGVPFLLDLRDLPDLTNSEQKGMKHPLWLSLKSWLIDLYIKDIARHSVALLCVGAIATAFTQLKLKGIPTRVVNVHNGFDLSDLKLVRDSAPPVVERETGLVVGCVGNIHNFRDTNDLRTTLSRLNQRAEPVTFLHWGKAGGTLLTYIYTLKNIKYVACQPVPRATLLKELHRLDCFLLACAEDLIWEPTTSVFDYILYDKPVIFTGLRNNEAYCILKNTQTRIISAGEIKNFDFDLAFKKNADLLHCYSREYQFQSLLEVMRFKQEAS